ncbi:DBH-like monooxygenase protein 1 homolog [Branchiostoma lanceolatum]|uniref:DBH-like monooxygenase protein 1 homolog n=1 Tax=Branchiostoma lanceolatum TaxID=7740 RepID=UPI00345287E9
MIGLVVIVVTALLYGGSASAASDLPHHEVLDENGDFVLSWTFDDEQIEFEARVKTRGWLGLGLSPNGGMPGSDIVIGWVKDGQAYLTDRYAEEKALPPEDESQDWELLSGYENDTHTVLRFKRKLQTCDVRDRVINKDTLRVLWAWNDEDPDDAGPAYHRQNRGVRSSVFLRNNIESESVPRSVQSHDVTMTNVSKRSLHCVDRWMNQICIFEILKLRHCKKDNVHHHTQPSSVSLQATIPPKRTAYWCRLVEMPKLQTKHHIFKVQSVITPGNEGMVHHMIVYKCHPNPNRTVSPHEHPGHECFTPNMPQDWMECYKGSLIAAWAVGTGDVSFPSHVGYPIGDENDGGQVLLEVHYDNPLQKEGTTDNSGLKFLYTPELRQYDAGILAVMSSVDYSHIVPPYADDFRTETFCNQECLSAFMDEVGEPIRVFGNMPHAHLLARKIRTSLIRNGVETVLSQDDNFDFNLQYVRMLDEEFTIQRGDTIMTECTYNSAHQNQSVYGGLGTENEMCESVLFYYPRIDMILCESSPHPLNILSFAGVEEINYSLEAPGWINNIPIVKPANMSDMTYEDVVESMVWDQEKAQRFSRHLREGPFISDCGFRGQSFHGTSRFRKESPLPKASVPAAAPEDVCSSASGPAGPEMAAMTGVLSLAIFSVLSTL